MAKRVFAGLGVFVCLALLALWRLGLGSGMPAAKAQFAPPEIPVTAGVVVARDMPQYLEGIGTVQAYNTVTV
jgi:membrane fusion protein, multidrug efflux system